MCLSSEVKQKIFKVYHGGQEKFRLHSESNEMSHFLTLSCIGSEILKQSTNGM